MILREATLHDADLLYHWRNDPAARMQFIQQEKVSWDQHLSWLQNSLQDSFRKIYIAEVEETPVGTLRFDYIGSSVELSWNLAPECRGRGLGVLLLREGIALARGMNLIARIKASNAASIRIAEKVGFVRISQDGDVLLFSKAP